MADSAAHRSSTTVVADVIDDGRVSGQQILVVGLCMFFNMLDGFDITAMAVVATSVATDLNLTDDKLGLIFGFALAGMMGGAMLIAPIADVIGRRKLIILSLMLVGVSILFTATATTLTEFIILRFVSGIGAGALLASQATLAAEYSPSKFRALSVTAVTSGYPMGAMMTSVVAGFIMPDFGWRGMFWFGGIVTLVMGFVAWTLIPESLKYLFERRPVNALRLANNILTKLKKDTLAELPEIREPHSAGSKGIAGNVASLLSDKFGTATLTLWVTFFLCFSSVYFMMSWIPKLMVQSGFSTEVGRDAFFLYNLGALIGTYILGTMAIRWKLSNIVSGFLFTSGVLMVIFAAAPNELTLLLALTFVIGVLQQGGFTGLYAVAAKVYPTEIRSTGIGWAIGLGRLGAVAGPVIAGFLIAAGVSMSGNYFIFAVPMAIGGLMAYRLHVK